MQFFPYKMNQEPNIKIQFELILNPYLYGPQTPIFIAMSKCLCKYEFLSKSTIWLFHFNVWQNSLQIKKINENKMMHSSFFKDPYDKYTHKMYICLWKHWRHSSSSTYEDIILIMNSYEKMLKISLRLNVEN